LASSNDDDDWLKLDDDGSDAVHTADDATALNSGDLASPLDDFTAGDEPLPSGTPANNPIADADDFGAGDVGGGDVGAGDVGHDDFGSDGFGTESSDDDLFGDLPPIDIPAMAPPPKRSAPIDPGAASMAGLGPPVKNTGGAKPPTAGSTSHQTEFRLKCNVCGSLMYAKASQEGKKIKCSDCHSLVVVPPPPKVKQSPKIDISKAQTFEFGEAPKDARREDPFRKSAADLLERAEKEDPEQTADDFETPDILEWARNVFGIFTDLNVILRLIIFTLIGAVPAYFVLAMDSPIAVLALFIGGALFAAPLIACGFAILQSVANDEPSVDEWPSLDPMEWLGSAGVAFAAAGFSGVPVFVLAQFLFDNSLIIIGVTMMSIYFLFPFVLLSMLDMQTIMMPFSPEVARSFNTSQESWGGFYFSAGVLFLALFLLFVATTGSGAPAMAFINVGATVAIVFAYFAMIGRLAYAIGQSVNESPREPDDGKNDQEKSADHA
tara:strand:- start:53356 stop:54837 length:1482 start_codon:yes stop_codon:yes gene_type:complete